MKFAGTHLLVDLWGAANLTDPELIDRALREAAPRRPARRFCTAISITSRLMAACPA